MNMEFRDKVDFLDGHITANAAVDPVRLHSLN